MSLGSGESFAGYRVLQLLGSGGMGEVYLVQHPRLPRQEALKVLRADISSDPAFRERFIREADLAAGLRHPHIVGIHDRGEYEGRLWIAMDYIDGSDLAHLLAQRYPAGMPIDFVVSIVTAVASALDYAHKKGLLHRDVKPANIIVADLDSDDPQIFLADFGIARPLNDPGGLTATNMTVGTVAYAAPEQLMGEDIDGRADEYALAATTYHLLTGVQLFPNTNPAVVISRHLNAAPPWLSAIRTDLKELDATLAQALAKRVEMRFQCCADFARACTGHGSVGSAVAPTQFAATPLPDVNHRKKVLPSESAPNSPKRKGLIAAVVGVLIVGVCATWWLSRGDDRDRSVDAGASTSAPTQAASPPLALPTGDGRTSPTTVTTIETPISSLPTVGPQAGLSDALNDYIAQNGIQATIVHPGDSGPTIDLPIPRGWSRAAPSDASPLGGLIYNDPVSIERPPRIKESLYKLKGNIDPATVLALAPAGLKDLPSYQSLGSPGDAELGGFKASQVGGSYIKNGDSWLIAQKTTVIPTDGGLFVFQLVAQGLETDMPILMDATAVIDKQTEITP